MYSLLRSYHDVLCPNIVLIICMKHTVVCLFSKSNNINAIYAPGKDDFAEHTPQISIETLQCIAPNWYKELDFSEESIPTKIKQVLLHLMMSSKITPEEQSLGTFTCHRLKTCPTWNKWEAGEHQQLDQLKDLEIFGAQLNPLIIQLPSFYAPISDTWLNKMVLVEHIKCCDGSKHAAPLLYALV